MLLLCLLVAVQGPPAPRHDLGAYLALARQYRTSEPAATTGALAALRDWTSRELADAQRALRSRESRLRSHAVHDGDVDVRVAEAAALLHVEAGLRLLQQPNEAEGTAQLDLASALALWMAEVATKRRERPPPDDPGVSPAGWLIEPRLDPATLHLAIADAALALGFPEIGLRHADEARRLRPTDSRALLTAGCAREGLAYLRALDGASRDARRLSDDALEAYRDVLAVDASSDEARLRRGRLLVQDGRLVEGTPLLERVAREAREDRQRYLALLFLARASEQSEGPRRAGELYSRALEARPDGTAARLGLALQLERQAGPTAARTLVLEALSRSGRIDSTPDPWSSYLFGRVDAASASLRELWNRVLAP